MRLEYVGPAPAPGAAVPLPEGWPAADHDEPDRQAAAAKLASGLYRRPRKVKEDTHASDS